MPTSHGQQKRQEKHKKRRELVRRREQDKAAMVALPTNPTRLIQRASSFPHGPTFISPEWRDQGEEIPALVSIVVTRRAPGGALIPAIALVDRTCLGVKNGFVGRSGNTLSLMGYLGTMRRAHGAMEECDLLVAQSVLFHAIDFAHSLGFAPHHDFPEPLFGPRPEALLDTPYARPSRPIYASGPDDDPIKIIRQLRRAVGTAFSFSLGPIGSLLTGDHLALNDQDEYEDDEGEEDEVDVQMDGDVP